jgi:L-evernosamine nitrososynthase
VSEPNQHLTRPATRATRTEGGWRIEGRKVFVTMAPAATVFYTAVTFVDDRGRERYGYAFVPAATPGVVVGDDWDALGMRASASYSVTFEGAEVPAAALGGGFAVGDTRAYMERNLAAGAFHAAASLGIAEAASRAAIDGVVARGNGHRDGRTRQLAADSAIRLSASRAVLARAATLADDWHTDGRTDRDPDAVVSLFAEVQSAKAFVTETAVAIVDDALALTGGAGYMNGHPLSRAYRDVRAGGFMHPLGANRVYDFVGDVALAAEPALG